MDTPRLLVLRIWDEPKKFRAVVREFDPERTHLFADLGQLVTFLRTNEEIENQQDEPGEAP